MRAPEGGEVAIRCVGLCKRFGDIEALKPLDLAIPQGSVFGYLGRNGAGKTTTIRLLAGLAHPTAGSAEVAGVASSNGDCRARHQFGYLPQDPAFYNWMMPGEYLDYVGRLFGMDRDARRKRIDELLSLVELQSAARRRIGGFSGGMFQRLGIAQALIHDPPVLLLDEPTSSLDPAGRHEVLDLLAGLRRQVTVFLSSHILADVERICDTIGIIRKGELVLLSGRDELLERYAADTAQVELDPASMETAERLVERLTEEPWIGAVQQDQNRLNIRVADVDYGKRALLQLIADQGAVVNRYEWVRPSLEEIFLRTSA